MCFARKLENGMNERLQGEKCLEPEETRGAKAVGCDYKRQPFSQCMLVTTS